LQSGRPLEKGILARAVVALRTRAGQNPDRVGLYHGNGRTAARHGHGNDSHSIDVPDLLRKQTPAEREPAVSQAPSSDRGPDRCLRARGRSPARTEDPGFTAITGELPLRVLWVKAGKLLFVDTLRLDPLL